MENTDYTKNLASVNSSDAIKNRDEPVKMAPVDTETKEAQSDVEEEMDNLVSELHVRLKDYLVATGVVDEASVDSVLPVEILRNYFETVVAGVFDSGKIENPVTQDNYQANVNSIKPKTVNTETFKQEMAEIFGDTNLSEEFFEKTSVLFESAVVSKVTEELEKLREEKARELEEYKATLEERVDSYLSRMVSEWYDQNQVVLEYNMKAAINENILSKLKTLFNENYFEISDDQEDLVTEMTEKVNKLEEEINNVLAENNTLKSKLIDVQKATIINEMMNEVPVAKREKFKILAENISHENSLDVFKRKLEIIKENYFDSREHSKTTLVLEDSFNEPVNLENYDPMIKNYVEAISRTSRKV